MIKSTVRAFPHFDELEAKVRARTVRALEAAATAGAAVATAQAAGTPQPSAFHPTTVERSPDGYNVGIRGGNSKWRIFDKGSLGKRTAKLKRDRRKADWPVQRKGTTYTAHRRSTETGGVAPRNISTPARTAGRKALLAAIRGH